MHDTRLVREIVARVNTVAREHGVAIEGVLVEIGALSHITPDAFVDHFEVFAAGSMAEDATLDISRSEDREAEDAFDVRLVSVTVSD